MVNAKNSYCAALVREQDPDRFLLAQFAPAEKREALYALFAFNHEIAKTREVVSETQLGLIRLQWWRDALEKLYNGEVLDYPILQALAPVTQAYDLPRDLFDALIYAREFDLEDVRPTALEGLLHYCDYTATPLLQLVTLVLEGGYDHEPVPAVATNYALAGLFRGTVFFARQRRCYLPESLMEEEGVKLNQLYELKPQDGMEDVVRECAGAFVFGVKPQNRFLKASQKLSELYIRQLAKYGYDVFHPRLSLPPAFKALRLALNV